MIDERYTAPLSRYSKTNSGMSVDAVEAWLDQFPQKRAENKPNGGIVRSIADTDRLFLREMNDKERKKARAQAKREHKQALRNLAKQDSQDAKEIKKQIAAWKAEEAQKLRDIAAKKKQKALSAKRAKQAAEKAKREEIKNAKKSTSGCLNDKTLEANNRRQAMAEKLKLGGRIDLVTGTSKAEQAAYQMQKKDMRKISEGGLNVIRVKSLKTGFSFFQLDTFARYCGKPMRGTLEKAHRTDLVKAICSGEILRPADLTRGVRVGAASMRNLVENNGLNIYTIMDRRHIIGWLLIDEQ